MEKADRREKSRDTTMFVRSFAIIQFWAVFLDYKLENILNSATSKGSSRAFILSKFVLIFNNPQFMYNFCFGTIPSGVQGIFLTLSSFAVLGYDMGAGN